MARRGKIPFFTDEDVADSVGDAILAAGHDLVRLRDVMVRGSADPVVATACREGGLVLVTHNYRDFRRISRDLEVTRGRFDQLHRIELICSQTIAADRFRKELPLIEHEWKSHPVEADFGIRIVIGDKIVRVDRRAG
jgi:hypothetical protein